MDDWVLWAFRGLVGILAAYVVSLTARLRSLETDLVTLTQRFNGNIELRTTVVSSVERDLRQLNARVKAIEDDRVIQADMLARLRTAEELLRTRQPERPR